MRNPPAQPVNFGQRVAELAKVFSDATRANIIGLLMQRRQGMTTMDICTRLGLLQPRTSSHLSVLLEYGVVLVTESGRRRVYSLSSSEFGTIAEALASTPIPGRLSGPSTASPEALKRVRNNSEVKQCRTCYDHLAGMAGVELLQGMLEMGWLVRMARAHMVGPGKTVYRVTRLGSLALKKRGVDVARALSSKRIFAYGCQDWTERRLHLGGSLGHAVLESILSQGMVERRNGTRALRLLRPISSWISSMESRK